MNQQHRIDWQALPPSARSKAAWEMVKTAKEEVTKLVNVAASKLPDTATGVELSQMILQISQQIEKMPTQVALEYLKKEVGQVF